MNLKRNLKEKKEEILFFSLSLSFSPRRPNIPFSPWTNPGQRPFSFFPPRALSAQAGPASQPAGPTRLPPYSLASGR
jgi:hypothetical protein